MTAHTPHIDPEGLGAAIAAWQADVPATVAYPELTAAPDDAATAAVSASRSISGVEGSGKSSSAAT